MSGQIVQQSLTIFNNRSHDQRVGQVLYLVPNHDLLNFVSGFFRRVAQPVFFGLVSDWHARLLDMSVLKAAAQRQRPLRHLLR